ETKLASLFRIGSMGASRFGHSFEIKSIPDAANALEVARVGGRRLDLATQVGDLVIDHTFGDHGFLAPDFVDEDAARQHASRAAREQRQELELERRGGHCAAGAAQLRAGEIELALAKAHHVSLARGRLPAAQERADAGAQLLRAVWLGDEIVGAEVE